MANQRDLCRECGSASFIEGPVKAAGGGYSLLAGQGSIAPSDLRAFICTECGHMSVFVPQATRAKLAKSKHWAPFRLQRSRKSS